MRKQIFIGLGAILMIVLLGLGWKNYLSPTKVAFVNFPEFQIARIVKATDNFWIDVTSVEPDEVSDMNQYDAIFMFGMGLKIGQDQIQEIKDAGDNGSKIFVFAATNPKMDISNIEGESKDKISAYFSNAGNRNYASLLNYTRKYIDGKSLFTDDIEEPKEIPSDVLFDINGEQKFETVEAYEKWYKDAGLWKKGGSKVALMTSIVGPFNSNTEHISGIISTLENKGMNVYAVSSFRKRLDMLKAIQPELIVYLPHGRLNMGAPGTIPKWLEKQNIPVLCPLTVFQDHDKWLKDPQGMFGGLLSQSVTMPELDGGINPYAVIAQFEDENGFKIFKPIPGRMEKFGDMAEKFIKLRYLENKDKKVAIYYFKGPGLNAMVAANMEVVPSLYRLVKNLKKEGYTVNNLPQSEEEFENLIMTKGPVLGPYALGTFNEYLKNGDPAIVSSQDYMSWCEKDLRPEMIQDMEELYGKAPGDYMSITDGDKSAIAVTRVDLGNIVLLPQPLPGIGDNTFQLVHGAGVAPTHPYVASYLWTQNEFKADAVIHFGTHGSLEFTPGKQIALSDYDWTDPLIGTTPHFYVYTISNVGEGMIAKRRSYATLVSHLTPPFMEGETYNELKDLQQKLQKYQTMNTGSVKSQYAKNITADVQKLGLYKDLDLDSLSKQYNEDELLKLGNFVEEIAGEKITGGLYTVGKPYEKHKINETALMMSLDPVAYSLSNIDRVKSIVSEKQLKNKFFFNSRYKGVSEKAVKLMLDDKDKSDAYRLLSNWITDKDLKWAKEWEVKNNKHSSRRAMMAMMSSGSKNKSDAVEADKDNIQKTKDLVAAISASEEKKTWFEGLKSKEAFDKASRLLDESTRNKAKKMAKFVPKMKKSLEIAEDPNVIALLTLMQNEELKDQAFSFINDPDFINKVKVERKRLEEKEIAFLNKNNISSFVNKMKKATDVPSMRKDAVKGLLNVVEQVEKRKAYWGKADWYYTDFDSDLKSYNNTLELRLNQIENNERTLAEAYLKLDHTLSSVNLYKQQLTESPNLELEGIINALNGGYIPPSPGGDPITNPNTIPTGRNLFAVNAEATPSEEAWEVGRKLGDALLENFKSSHDGEYPKKVSFTLWSGSFIETEGATIAQILYLLGVEPIRDMFGRINDVRLIPLNELERPRIDVVVQTSGQFRDLAASRLFLINKAVKMAAEAVEEGENYVKSGVKDAESIMIDKGLSPKEAREMATYRIFGGVNGNYGTGIMDMVEKGDKWEDTEEIAKQYIQNMGAIYGSNTNWGAFKSGIFEAALQNTEAVVQPRQSNTWGALSLDHVYEFMGGINSAVTHVTGKEPEGFFNDFRNPNNPRVQGLKEAIQVEARSTLLNPKYISEYMKGGASSAENFAETFRNTFGWNAMKESVIEDQLWDELYDVYIDDKLNLEVHKFFENKNPYALQEMSAIMLETVRKGMWDASPEQIKALSELHADLVKDHKAGCSGFVCDNAKLRDFISQNLSEQKRKDYQEKIENVRTINNEKADKSLVLEKEEVQQQKVKQVTETDDSSLSILLIVVALVLLLLIVFLVYKRKSQDKA
ncbi:MAG: cobaltochelatase subunit CobN [Hyphomicrobiales bacterium]